MKRVMTVLGLAAVAATPVMAQQNPQLASATAPAKQKLGLIAFPAKNQTPDQQSQDEQACYNWARQQIDPLAGTPNSDSMAAAGKARADSASKGAALKGAAGGVAGGALIGAAAGDAGDGARVGAMAGALRGRRARKEAEQKAEQQARAEAQARSNQQVVTFRKAMTACLEGKGYTVQ
jgi:hypothetical protein